MLERKAAIEEERIELGEQFWKKMNGEQLGSFLKRIARSKELASDHLAFVCIGTDRSTGDALGPLVGSKLVELGYKHVFGTLESPCDATNLPIRLQEIPSNAVVIAIDACLGRKLSVGMYQLSNQPLAPGKSVGKVLPPIGDYAIAAIVNADGPRQYNILQTTSLYHVLRMADEVTEAISYGFPLSGRASSSEQMNGVISE